MIRTVVVTVPDPSGRRMTWCWYVRRSARPFLAAYSNSAGYTKSPATSGRALSHRRSDSTDATSASDDHAIASRATKESATTFPSDAHCDVRASMSRSMTALASTAMKSLRSEPSAARCWWV